MNLAVGLGLLVVLYGHLAIWCAIYNQLHATAWPRPSRKLLEKIIYVIVLAIAWLVVRATWSAGSRSTADTFWPTVVATYHWICVVAAAAVTARWIFRRLTIRTPHTLLEQRRTLWDLRREFERLPIHGVQARLLNLIPGNEIFKLVFEHKTIALRGLPRQSEGLRIVQLSDLHFTGKVGIEFFKRIVELCNQANPDLVVLTGDVVDQASCLNWLDQTLGQVQANLGRFYVLGNHDRRVADSNQLRDSIEATGFMPLNGQWHKLEIAGGCLWLSGNELPWYRGAESLPLDPPSDVSAPRVLVAHSPDQFRWALARNIDLMLTGHCHGGQIRLPLIGPIISPSRFGVRFASGAFELGALTMLVSRGISADDPIRLHCPPELTVIELVAARA